MCSESKNCSSLSHWSSNSKKFIRTVGLTTCFKFFKILFIGKPKDKKKVQEKRKVNKSVSSGWWNIKYSEIYCLLSFWTLSSLSQLGQLPQDWLHHIGGKDDQEEEAVPSPSPWDYFSKVSAFIRAGASAPLLSMLGRANCTNYSQAILLVPFCTRD